MGTLSRRSRKFTSHVIFLRVDRLISRPLFAPARRPDSESRDKKKKRDKDHKSERHKVSGKGREEDEEDGAGAAAEGEGGIDLAADLTPEEIQMMQAMGIPFSFDTTQGKEVSGDGGRA